MTKLSKFLTTLIFISSLSFAQTKRVETISDVQGINNLENLMPNPGFDKNSNGMTATGFTASSATSGSNLGRGPRSLVVDMDTVGDIIETANMVIPNYMRGQNGVAFCRFRNPGTTGGSTTDYQLRVTDGTNNLSDVTTNNVIPLTTTFQRHSQSFIFPTSGNVRLQIRAQSATVTEMAIDDCYIGLADNQALVSMSQFVGSSYFATTASCLWQRTNTAIGAFGTDADCPGPTIESQKIGTWATTDADLPQQTIANLPPGIYEVKATFGVNSSTGVGVGVYTLSDGTTTSGRGFGINNTTNTQGTAIVGYFEYTTAGDRTFAIHASMSANTINIDNSASGQRLTFGITRFPLASELAQRPDTVNQFASIRYAGATNCAWTTSAASFTDLADDADCNSVTTRGIGSADGTKPSLRVPGLRPGTYLVMAKGTFNTNESSSGTAACAWRIHDGTTGSPAALSSQLVSKGRGSNDTTFGIFNYTSTQGQLNFRIQGFRTSGNADCELNNGVTNGSAEFELSLIPLTNNIQNPLLVGSVSTSEAGLTRIEAFKSSSADCTTGTCAFAVKTAGVSAVTFNATGVYDVTFVAGTFASEPYCVVTNNRGASNQCCNMSPDGTLTSPSRRITCTTCNSAAAVNSRPEFICIGPR